MKQRSISKIDISKIEGAGDFPCPNCGVIISPDDETETVYSVIETKTKNDALEELILQCNKCKSKIHLVGFLTLQNQTKSSS
jgi:phage terminase large subunit GpA-like protein